MGAAFGSEIVLAPDVTSGRTFSCVTHEDEQQQSGRRIGEVASASGLTVRTLHHYEQIGFWLPRSDRLRDTASMSMPMSSGSTGFAC